MGSGSAADRWQWPGGNQRCGWQLFAVALGTQLLDDTESLAGWTACEAQGDSFAFFGADLSRTTPSQAVVDNIGISSSGRIPEPGTALLAMVAGLGLLARRRRVLRSNLSSNV